MASIGTANEEPVLLADGGGADGVFDEVVVDLDSAIVEVCLEVRHLGEGVVNSRSHARFRQEPVGALPDQQDVLDALDDRSALVAASHGAQFGTGAPLSKPGFGPVEGGDLTQDPSGLLWGVLAGFVEAAPGVCPASNERKFAGVGSRKGGVGRVAVALDGATEVHGDHVFEAFGSTARFPSVDHIASGTIGCPEVAEFGRSIAGSEVADRRLINLNVLTCQDLRADGVVNGPQPVGGKLDPAGLALTWKEDVVPGFEDSFLTVERERQKGSVP